MSSELVNGKLRASACDERNGQLLCQFSRNTWFEAGLFSSVLRSLRQEHPVSDVFLSWDRLVCSQIPLQTSETAVCLLIANY